MSAFTNLLFHVVYSTKYRKPMIEKTASIITRAEA